MRRTLRRFSSAKKDERFIDLPAVRARRLNNGECFSQRLRQGRRGGTQFDVFGHNPTAQLICQSKEARVIGADSVPGGDRQDRCVRNARQFSIK